MEVIEAELAELRKTLEQAVPDSKLVTCVPSSIRVEIAKSDFKRFTICLTYPSDYPATHVLIELKSKTLSAKLLDGLVRVAEDEAKKQAGRPHCLAVVKFVARFFEDNPLSVCSDEMSKCKAMLEDGVDRFKLSQKTSSVSLHVAKDKYYFKTKVVVPHE